MYRLLLLLLPVLVLMPAASDAQTSPTISAVYLIPSDNDTDPAHAQAWLCEEAMPAILSYYEGQTGYTYKYTCQSHVTPRTEAQMATALCGGIPCADVRDACGQGVDGNRVFDVLRGELGLATAHPYRVVVVVANGGGTAGGASGSVPNMSEPPALDRDEGYAFIGDWGASFALTGQPDPCCLERAGLGSCIQSPLHAITHEMCHGFGLWGCHSSADPLNPSVGYGVPLNAEDIRQFPVFNARFVRALPSPTETPTVVPATPTPTRTPKCPPGWRRQGRC